MIGLCNHSYHYQNLPGTVRYKDSRHFREGSSDLLQPDFSCSLSVLMLNSFIMQEDIGMERNGLSEITPSPKPHKKNILSQKHKVRNVSFCIKVVVFVVPYRIDCFAVLSILCKRHHLNGLR